MLLYQGSEFVRGNKFKDSKGNVLTFEKNTKDGKLFSTKDGKKLGLTEGQVSKLKLTDEKTRKALKENRKIKEADDTKWKIEINVNGELTYYNRLTASEIDEILSVANSISPNIEYESESLEEAEDLGELSTREVKALDWSDGNIACYKISDLSTKDFIAISSELNKADYVFKMNGYLCLYSKEVNGLGGRHFSDFKDSLDSYK